MRGREGSRKGLGGKGAWGRERRREERKEVFVDYICCEDLREGGLGGKGGREKAREGGKEVFIDYIC